jgi:uncharacterized protein (DUF983 family)
MNYKESMLFSIMNNKCPHCHKGNFWETSNPYDLKRFSKMNNRCPVCNEDFKREPGYYFGATYVSYGLTVAFGIAMYVVLAGFFDMDTVSFLITFSVSLIILMPVFYRSARLIWINMFVPFKKTN